MRLKTKITAYEGPEDNWRIARIHRVLSAARSFLANLDDDYSSFDRDLISVHDHKGTLEVVWGSQ